MVCDIVDKSTNNALIFIMTICLCYLFLFIPECYFYECRDIDKFVEDCTAYRQNIRGEIRPYLGAISSYKERYNVVLAYFGAQNIIIISTILFLMKRKNKTCQS